MKDLSVSTPMLLEMYEAMQAVVSGVPVEKTDMSYCVEILGELIEEWHELNGMGEESDEERDVRDKLDELYKLVEIESEAMLTCAERLRYVDIVEYLKLNNVEIPFGISL